MKKRILAFDFSTVSTGVAVIDPDKVSKKRTEILAATIALTKEENALKGWPRSNAMVSKICDLVKEYTERYDEVEALYEEVNVFLNANTIRAIARVTYPALFYIETVLDVRCTPVRVISARKELLGKPPYKKEQVLQAVKHVAKNNDEADAIALLFSHPAMIGIKPQSLVECD